jgi:PKD repeat protein
MAYHPQPAPDVTKMDYTPIGKFGPAGQNHLAPGQTASPTIPTENAPLAPTSGRRYNTSDKYVAYDSNLFETLTLPFRAAGDQSASDPPGNGGNQPDYGKCDPTAPPDPDGLAPLTPVAGRCPNHHLEYLDYFAATMQHILGPFGVTIKRYGFQSPGSSNTRSGRSANIAAVVPGADHPDQTVLVSGHYDQTTEGPASAWDSAEGHAEVIRMAKIMADYWRRTGTRPSATIKFIPWDQEESGLLGSQDYVSNNIPPGEEDKVRGYFNVDPCAGAYPAFYRGNPADRVPLVLQLVDPANHEDDSDFVAEVTKFNARAQTVVDDVFNALDDRLRTIPGQPEIYVSDQEARATGKDSQRDEVQTALGGLLLFTSDYSNFEEVGVPFFNLGPAFFGPSANGEPNRQDGIATLHTPNDNHRTINALTSSDQTGFTASEGWAKGMELCAQLESWYMLQPQMAGAQTARPNVVAYYEALPNEVIEDRKVTFDASGSYQYSSVANRTFRNADLEYRWSFGDGQTATGKVVQHSYPVVGRYPSRLTVRNRVTGASDTMTVPIEVIPSRLRPPRLKRLPARDADGEYTLAWTFDGSREGFQRFSVEEARDYRAHFSDHAEGNITDKYVVGRADDPRLQPWQPSDSATPKFRGNQRRSGERSYWTGVSPQDFNPGPASDQSILTVKKTIAVPTRGETTLSFWSLFQSEGDDQGRVEVALDDGNPATPLEWEPIHIIQALNTSLGGNDRQICDPSSPDTATRGFEHRIAGLGAYRGRNIRVRFVYRVGAENRAASQPCGWYIDDILLHSGSFTEIGSTRGLSFEVERAPGRYAYRIAAVYTRGIRTGPSNVETVQVTGGSGGD